MPDASVLVIAYSLIVAPSPGPREVVAVYTNSLTLVLRVPLRLIQGISMTPLVRTMVLVVMV